MPPIVTSIDVDRSAEEVVRLLWSSAVNLTVSGSKPVSAAWASRQPGQVLDFLMTNVDRVVTRNQIHETIWGEPETEASNAARLHIRRLRPPRR
jgi:two-component SAPR family response regulator